MLDDQQATPPAVTPPTQTCLFLVLYASNSHWAFVQMNLQKYSFILFYTYTVYCTVKVYFQAIIAYSFMKKPKFSDSSFKPDLQRFDQNSTNCMDHC